MFQLLKNLWGKKERVSKADNGVSHELESSVRNPAAPRIPNGTRTVPPLRECLQMPLATILDWLPAHLKLGMKADVPINGHVDLPLRTILEQMPRGRVRLSFRELKQVAPPDLFAATNEHADDLIDLPLREIVSRLKPGQLPRRAEQKRVDVSNDINPIFGAPAQQRANQFLSEARGGAAHEPGAGTRSTASVDHESKNSDAVERVPTISVRGFTARKLLSGNSDALPVEPAQTDAPQTEPSVSAGADLTLPLASLIGSWPEPVKQELLAIDVSKATISIPVGDLEQRLKRGKVVFKWHQLRMWIQPALPSHAGATNNTLELELPLSTVAPAFVTQRRPIAQRKRQLELLAKIPPLFAKTVPTAHSESPGQAELPSAMPSQTNQPELEDRRAIPAADTPKVARTDFPTPTEPVAVRQSSAEMQSEGVLELGDIFGEPKKRTWSPADIVERTTHLGGVAGALMATFDGLVVASRLPAELNSARVAAFVPLMFGRIAQYAKELNLGESNNLTFQINDIPLHVAKAGRVYFACLGRADEALPRADLTAIAAVLARQGAAS